MDLDARIKQIERCAEQNLRHQKRRQKKGLEHLAAEKAKANQPDRRSGAEHRRRCRGEEPDDQADPKERGDKGFAVEERNKPAQGQTARREFEGRAGAERDGNDHDQRRQQPDINQDHKG